MSVEQEKLTTREDIINHPDLRNIIYFSMKKLCVPHEDTDDVFQTTVLNLMTKRISDKSSVTYNIFQHTKWVYWNFKSKREVSKRDRIQVGYDKTPDVAVSEDYQTLPEFKEWYIENVRFLPLVDQQILRMSYIDGVLLREIGDQLGLTKQRVQQIRTRAIKKLREFYDKKKRR